MSSINKLAAYLQPKSATTPNKFGFKRQPRNTSHFKPMQVHQHYTPSYAQHRRRNYTENSKYNGRSAATLDIKDYGNDRRRSLNFKNDFGIRRSIDYEKLNTNQEEKLLLMRQEKLGKLKNMYHLKGKMNAEDLKGKMNAEGLRAKNSNFSGAKFNSIEPLGKKHSSEIMKHRDPKDIYFFNKRQDFHYVARPQKSERKVQKYFDFCEQATAKKYENSQMKETTQSQMPQVIKHDHIIGKVKSLKKFVETPPLVPITFKRNQQQPFNYLSLQWFKESYEPRLQIYNQVSYQAFTSKKINKGMYIGQLKLQTGEPQGIGFMFYPNGKIFQGHFKNGEKQGFGYENYPDGSYYLGNFVSGRREGKGKFQWSNGEIYDGEWKNNKKQGSGIWKGPNNLSYVGQWHHDVIEGFGVLVEAGIRYQGEFKNFMKWGNGTLRFQNGQIYTGNFKQNIPSGIGDYYWTNQDHYHGEFVNGKRHGEGVLRYSNAGVYRGQFQNDKKSGKGEQYYQDKLYYKGHFENDLRHGLGTLYCDGSILFEGYWLNNAAVDQQKGTIETIIEQQQSSYDKQTSKNSKMKKYQSNATLVRNKNMIKRQNKLVSRNKSNPKEVSQSPDKPFRRACNCERHRRRSPFAV